MLASTEEKALLRYLYVRESELPEGLLQKETLSEEDLKSEGLPTTWENHWQNLDRVLAELDEIDSANEERFGFSLYGDAQSPGIRAIVHYLAGLKLVTPYTRNPHVNLTPRGMEFGKNLRFVDIVEAAVVEQLAKMRHDYEKA